MAGKAATDSDTFEKASAASPHHKPALLTVTEACAMLQVSRWSLYRLMQSQSLGSVRIGRRRFVPATAIEAFLDELQRGGYD